MANTILTPTAVVREALRLLHNNLAFAKGVNRQYDDKFAQSGAKVGDSIQIRLPNRFTVRNGPTLSAQDVQEESVTLQVATQKGVDIQFSSAELTLSLDDFSKRILQPAMARLASEIDYDGLGLYQDVYNLVGTPGTTPNSALVYLQAGQKLDEFATPRDDNRSVVINPAAMAATVDALKGLFHDTKEVSKQYRRGLMGRSLGFEFAMDQNVRLHTVGAHGGTPLVNGANQTGSSLATDGWTASTTVLKKGDVFTIAGVYAVNPETGQSTGSLQQFVVTADVTSDAVGAATIPISPSIVTSGAKKTVTNSPADNAAITVVGSASTNYPQNLAYHRDAFVLATVDLVMPKGVDFAAREVYDGISMRIVRQYDINNDNFPCRIDVLYGWKCVRPEMACRIIG